MIEITAALARLLRAILRKCLLPGGPRGQLPTLALDAGPDGLRIRAQTAEVAVEYHQPGSRLTALLHLPSASLADFEGRKEVPVLLSARASDTVQARWDDAGVPQSRDYRVAEAMKLKDFPCEPDKLVSQPPHSLKALDDAARTAAGEATRYALLHLQLRGEKGQLVGTDGKQLLIQGGFSFPWKGDLLVPSLALFGCRELPQDGTVLVGHTESHVTLRVGPWTFHLAINKDGRFPTAEAAIPSTSGTVTVCGLSPADRAFLLQTLPRLPGQADDNGVVTVDLNGRAAIRARDGKEDRITEVVLTGSEVSGPAVRFVTNRAYLLRVAELGFAEFKVVKPGAPVVCRDKGRTYAWMPLGADNALPPTEDCVRLTPDQAAPAPQQPKKERRTTTVKSPPPKDNGNGHVPKQEKETSDDRPADSSIDVLIEEAQALKDVLREAHGRASRLLVGLKRHRHQGRLLRTTPASLRQLQQIGG